MRGNVKGGWGSGDVLAKVTAGNVVCARRSYRPALRRMFLSPLSFLFSHARTQPHKISLPLFYPTVLSGADYRNAPNALHWPLLIASSRSTTCLLPLDLLPPYPLPLAVLVSYFLFFLSYSTSLLYTLYSIIQVVHDRFATYTVHALTCSFTPLFHI